MPTRPGSAAAASSETTCSGSHGPAGSGPPNAAALLQVRPQRAQHVARVHEYGDDLGSMDSLKGQLLLAGPGLLDPNFRRTVVLVAEHSDEGAMGIVLNRAAEVAVDEAAPALGVLVEPGEPVFVGGPVEPESVLVLAEFDDADESASLVL